MVILEDCTEESGLKCGLLSSRFRFPRVDLVIVVVVVVVVIGIFGVVVVAVDDVL
jgi:hypothetical protein